MTLFHTLARTFAPLLILVPAAAFAQGDPGTRSLNNQVGADIANRQAMNAANQAQYQADLRAYDAAVSADARHDLRVQRRSMRRERAYADAMAVWRDQVRACKRGNNRACRAPTPNPADFY